MSLGIWKKLAALLSVICLSVAVTGCGPAAETPTGGDGPAAEDNGDEQGADDADDEEVIEDDSGIEDEGASLLE